MKKEIKKDSFPMELNVVIDFVIKLITLLGMLINLRIFPTPYFL